MLRLINADISIATGQCHTPAIAIAVLFILPTPYTYIIYDDHRTTDLRHDLR